MSVGFKGGQVLALRVPDDRAAVAQRRVQQRRLARAEDRGRPGAARPRQRRLRPPRGRGTQRRLRPEPASPPAVGALSARRSRAALRRTRGHSAALERAVRSFTRLGDHAGVWPRARRRAGPPPRRDLWLRAAGTVPASMSCNTSPKLVICRSRPQRPASGATSTPTRLSFPSATRPRRSPARSPIRGSALPAAPLYALAASLAVVAPVPRRPLSAARSPGGARHRRGQRSRPGRP